MQIGSNLSQSLIQENAELQKMFQLNMLSPSKSSFRQSLDNKLVTADLKAKKNDSVKEKPKKIGFKEDKRDGNVMLGIAAKAIEQREYKTEPVTEISEAETVELVDSINRNSFLGLRVLNGEHRNLLNVEASNLTETEETIGLTSIKQEETFTIPTEELQKEEPVVETLKTDLPFGERVKEFAEETKGSDFTGEIKQETLSKDGKAESEIPADTGFEVEKKVKSEAVKSENLKLDNEEHASQAISVNVKNAEGLKDEKDSSTKKDNLLSKTGIMTKSFTFDETKVETLEPVDLTADNEVRLNLINQISEFFTKEKLVYDKGLELTLNPASLGKITMIAKQVATGVAISIICESSKTHKLLAEQSKQLGAIMEKNLGEPTVIHIQDKAPDYLNRNRQNEEGRQGYQEQEQKPEKQNETDSFIARLKLGLN